MRQHEYDDDGYEEYQAPKLPPPPPTMDFSLKSLLWQYEITQMMHNNFIKGFKPLLRMNTHTDSADAPKKRY